MLEVLVRTLDADDGDAELLAHGRLGERQVVCRGRCVDLGDRKAIVEFNVVHHPATDEVGDALPHVGLGVDHVMRADALGDLAVLGRHGLHPDVGDLELGQRHDGHQAGRQVAADAHDRVREIGHAQLAHGHGIGRVGLDGMGEQVRPFMHRLRVAIDSHHVVPELHQGVGHGAAEAPQSDHDHTVAPREGELLGK